MAMLIIYFGTFLVTLQPAPKLLRVEWGQDISDGKSM